MLSQFFFLEGGVRVQDFSWRNNERHLCSFLEKNSHRFKQCYEFMQSDSISKLTGISVFKQILTTSAVIVVSEIRYRKLYIALSNGMLKELLILKILYMVFFHRY